MKWLLSRFSGLHFFRPNSDRSFSIRSIVILPVSMAAACQTLKSPSTLVVSATDAAGETDRPVKSKKRKKEAEYGGECVPSNANYQSDIDGVGRKTLPEIG